MKATFNEWTREIPFGATSEAFSRDQAESLFALEGLENHTILVIPNVNLIPAGFYAESYVL